MWRCAFRHHIRPGAAALQSLQPHDVGRWLKPRREPLLCPLIASSRFSSEKIRPCFKAIDATLDICLVFVDALLRAKLFKSKAVADESEASIALIATPHAALRRRRRPCRRASLKVLYPAHRIPLRKSTSKGSKVAGWEAGERRGTRRSPRPAGGPGGPQGIAADLDTPRGFET